MNTKDTKKKRRPKGTGAIFYKESRKSFCGHINVDIGKGKTKRKYVYGKTKTEVSDKLKDIEFRSKNREFIEKDESETMKFYDFAEMMIEERFAHNEIRVSTYDRHLSTLKMLADISGLLLGEITEETVKDFFLKKLGYSQSSLNKMYQLMGSVFKAALKKNLISDNPLIDVKRPKSRQELIPVRALTIGEQNQLLNLLLYSDVRYSEIMLLSLYTGMRVGECCALSVEDVDLDRKTLFIHKTVTRGSHGATAISPKTKNGSVRTITLDDDMVELLKGSIDERKNGFIFSSSNGKLVTTNQVNYSYAKALKDNGIVDNSEYGKVNLHSLRHTYATRLIESGVPAHVVQKELGHSDISITMNIYCSVFDKYREKHLETARNYMLKNNISIRGLLGCQA